MKAFHQARKCGVSFFAVLLCLLAANLIGGHGAVLAKDKKSEQAAKLMRKGEFEEAEKIYREALAKDARDLRARLGLGFSLLKQRKIQDAFDQAARATTIDPTSGRAHALLGATLLAAGNFPLSLEEFRTALTFNENDAMAVAGLAMINFYENRSNASLSGLRRAVFLDPYEPDYVFNLAQAAARTENYKEAADAYERFLQVSPTTDADRRARIRGLIDFLRYLGNQRSLYRANSPPLVAIPFEPTGGRPIIKVRLNDAREEFRFVVDTGSGMSVISDRTAERLGVRPAARGGMARAVGGGGRFEIVYGFLNSIDLGEASVENVPVYVRRFYNDQESIDGYIGLSLLSKFVTAV
ncbi:MAG TPA: aspartyl protease family protein, partial [Pyrinomonadaceae bacterium]|nr:aspartyl protease family protein [Pyrinomonadaceae bacterium]